MTVLNSGQRRWRGGYVPAEVRVAKQEQFITEYSKIWNLAESPQAASQG